MKGEFNRISSGSPEEKYGVPLGWVAISYRWMPEQRERRLSHGRWYRISSAHGTTFRALRFSPNLKGTLQAQAGDVVVDWQAWLKLAGHNEIVPDSLSLSFRRVRPWEWPRVMFSHPDPGTRLSMILGFLSLLLALWSIYLSLRV